MRTSSVPSDQATASALGSLYTDATPSPTHRILPWLLLAPICALSMTRELWAPDEPRYAQIAREIVERSDWLVLHLNGSLYPDKPPLVYWLSAVCGLLGGWSEFMLRVPSLLATAGTAWIVSRFARRLWEEQEAAWAVALYLGTAMTVWLGGRFALDPLLSFFCLLSVYLATEPDLVGARAGRQLALAGLFAGLGALTKGPVAWLHIGLALAVVRVLPRGSFGPLPRSRAGWSLFALLALAPVLAWATAASIAERALWKPLFFGQHFGRVADAEAHRQPFWYHAQNQPLQLLPWTFLVVAALVRAWRKWRDARSGRVVDGGLLWAAAWLSALFVVFSAIPVKRELYLFPMYPAAALLAARELTLAQQRGGITRWVSVPTLAVSLLVAAALVGAPWVAFDGEAAEILGDRARIISFVSVLAGIALLACTLAATLALRRARIGSWSAALLVGFGVVGLTVAVVVPPAVNPRLSARSIAESMAARPERPTRIPCLGVQAEGYRFYGGVPTVRVTSAAELEEVIELEGPQFLALVRTRNFEALPDRVRARLVVHDQRKVGSRDVFIVGAQSASR